MEACSSHPSKTAKGGAASSIMSNVSRERWASPPVVELIATFSECFRLMSTLSLVFWVCWIGAAFGTQPSPQAATGLLWSADVTKDLSGARNPTAPYLLDRNRAGVAFLDNEKLAVYEVIVDAEQFSSRQNVDVSSPFRLQVSLLDAESGKLLFVKDWGTRAHESSVQVTKGGLLLQTGDRLRLLSRDLGGLTEVSLSDADGLDKLDQWDRLVVSVSATGETLMANRFSQKKNLSRFDVVDGSTLKLRYSWSESPPLYDLYSISDRGIAAADSSQQHIIFKEFGSRRWSRVGDKSKIACVGLPTLVTDVLMVNGCKRLSCLSVGGELIFQDTFEKGEWLERKAAVSQNGRAVAVSLKHTKGKDFWDTGGGIKTIARDVVLYDLSLKRRALTVGVAPLPNNDYDFAVSPDGSKLAILNDRRVSVYLVPERTGAR